MWMLPWRSEQDSEDVMVPNLPKWSSLYGCDGRSIVERRWFTRTHINVILSRIVCASSEVHSTDSRGLCSFPHLGTSRDEFLKYSKEIIASRLFRHFRFVFPDSHFSWTVWVWDWLDSLWTLLFCVPSSSFERNFPPGMDSSTAHNMASQLLANILENTWRWLECCE